MSDTPCTVVVTDSTSAVDVAIHGEFDVTAVDAVTIAIRPHLARAVVVDLDAVTFMDSSGVKCLLQLHTEAPHHRGRVTVSNVSPTARRVLELGGIIDKLLRSD